MGRRAQLWGEQRMQRKKEWMKKWSLCWPLANSQRAHDTPRISHVPSLAVTCSVTANNVTESKEREKSSAFFISPGFPDSSVGKESSCNAEDLCLIPGLGRSLGEGKGYPTPVFWPGEFQVCIVRGVAKIMDVTERLSLTHHHLPRFSLMYSWMQWRVNYLSQACMRHSGKQERNRFCPRGIDSPLGETDIKIW